MKALLVLKDLQPNRPDKATYLANHKKTRLWPWTQLSASPRTVYFRWCRSLTMLTTPRRAHPKWWTTARPRKGTTQSRGRCDSGSPCGEEYEGSLVRLRCEAAVAAGPAVGIVWAVRPPLQHSRPQEAGACGTTGAALGGWSKKTRG